MREDYFLVVLLLVYTAWFCTCRKTQYRVGTTDHAIRIINFSECYTDKTRYLYQIETTILDYRQYLSCVFRVEETFQVKLIQARFDRCRGHHFACENFHTWNFTHYCKIATMRNQVWTAVVDSITPTTWKKTCPTIPKGNYTVKNAQIDINSFLRLYPDAANYHWQGTIYAFDDKNVERYCFTGVGYITSYNKRGQV